MASRSKNALSKTASAWAVGTTCTDRWLTLKECRCGSQNGRQNTHPFNGPLSTTTWVSQYQKGKTNLDFTEARDSEWQWHQLGHVQVCTLLQIDNHASTPPLSFFTGQIPFLPPSQQRQSTEGRNGRQKHNKNIKIQNVQHTTLKKCPPIVYSIVMPIYNMSF